jgi:hypothetical protein
MPLAWLRKGDATAFEKMPTLYGPVTLKTSVSDDGKTLSVDFLPQFRHKLKRVMLHVPRIRELARLRLNGKEIGGQGDVVDVTDH